ncbi:MAG: YbjN domain-containing protein, partial [Anaerolineae bacterium]|nr:YbjN domain-containing protein [Anaerolineae bacterium]
MSVTLSDLTQAFDALGWRYQTVPDHDLLLTSFRTEGGSADLVLRPVAEGQAVLLEAMGLGSQPRERAEMLLALAWRWTGVAIARDPEDGEVRLRLILPVGEASLATAPLRAAVGMLLAAVDAFRQAVAQEDVEDVGAQRAVPDTVEAQRAASDALPAAAQRAMALLEALSQAPDQAAFLREHLDEFDGEVLAALAAMAQTAQKAGETEFAQGMAAVAAAVLDLRLERDPQARAHQEQLQRLLAAEDEAN